MNWFVARIIYQINCGSGNHRPQFDEQLKLISAEDQEMAFVQASLMGERGQDAFANTYGEEVHWKFIGVTELTRLSGLESGTELFSAIVEVESAEGYANFIREKNNDIKSRLVSLTAYPID